ncbi:ribosome recycling factor [Desulfohalotomaculum tongense]|uniref:ribosome recycling factor n=1 Tax=Desulforadius tongensis TaxID=1216062 RepID=UPI0019594320|nr:ribosome recycling factor [Desulforadius tongensis]MBM7854423.1 ribosome recycling factor [Desulforadius tongensis]
MINDIMKDAEERMKKSVEVTKSEFASLRAGRATPALLDKIQVDYYGTPTPINQLANISVPEPRLLVIQPWDKSVIPEIEKSIQKSDLGINPTNDGTVVRLTVPQLTEERRAELVKVVKKKAEEGRVAVRNVRREAIDELKTAQKEGLISEDELKRGQDSVQKLTDKYVKEIDELLAAKEKDIMQV